MKGLIEFGGEGGGVVVVEVDDHDPGFVRAGSDDLITRVQSTFAQALRMLHPATEAIIAAIDELPNRPSEIEVEMGIKFNAKVGAVLASTGGDSHIRMKLSWEHPVGSGPLHMFARPDAEAP